MTPLKERHRVFIEKYLANGGHGVDAARDAGYSGNDRVLSSRASELLARKDVKAALKDRTDKDPKVADRAERQQWWTRIMRGKIKAGWKERLEASKLLARSQGDFIDRHEHTVKGAVVIVTLPDNGRGDGPGVKDIEPGPT
jgi:hypothetical protein